MLTLTESVGMRGHNRPVDVIKTQALVNSNDLYTGLQPLELSGKVDVTLINAIKTFQINHPQIKARHADGRIDPGGRTLIALNDCANKARQTVEYFPTGLVIPPSIS